MYACAHANTCAHANISYKVTKKDTNYMQYWMQFCTCRKRMIKLCCFGVYYEAISYKITYLMQQIIDTKNCIKSKMSLL